jgi:NAD(P)H-nitrite reductase large subunit
MENSEKIICTCMDVTENEIIDAIKNNNCKTIEEIGDKTGAGTVCGGCVHLIKKIIENQKK